MMRAKHLNVLNYIPSIPDKVRLVWSRITLSRVTTFYFALAVVHCFLQMVLQTRGLVVNIDAHQFLQHVEDAAGLGDDRSYVVLEENGPLFRCTGIPQFSINGKEKDSAGLDPCTIIWGGPKSGNASVGGAAFPTGKIVAVVDGKTITTQLPKTFTLPPAYTILGSVDPSSTQGNYEQVSSSAIEAPSFSSLFPSSVSSSAVYVSATTTPTSSSTPSSSASTSTLSPTPSPSLGDATFAVSSFSTSSPVSSLLLGSSSITTVSASSTASTTSVLLTSSSASEASTVGTLDAASASSNTDTLVSSAFISTVTTTTTEVVAVTSSSALLGSSTATTSTLTVATLAAAATLSASSQTTSSSPSSSVASTILASTATITNLAPLISATPPVTQVTVTVSVTQIATPGVHEKVDDSEEGEEEEHTPHRRAFRSSHGNRDLKIGQAQFDANGNFQSITVSGANVAKGGADSATLNPQCIRVLAWPVQTLQNTEREDTVFLLFNLWVFGMSLVALLNESIPHIVATVLTHALAIGWSIFQLVHTANFRTQFLRLTRDGACDGANLLASYWGQRAQAEIPSLALNCLALVFSIFLSWRLLKQFGWQTFKRIGASLSVNYAYRLVLSLSVALQLAFFFIVVSMVLWIDQLCNGMIGRLAIHGMEYRAVYIVVLLFLVPWMAAGWFGLRREYKLITAGFLVMALFLIVSWFVMFASDTFRMTFLTWKFFAVMSIIAIGLIIIIFILGICCRLNFGKNATSLASYLETPEEISDFEEVKFGDNYDLERGEKVNFPTQGNIPTFAVAFGSQEVDGSNNADQSAYPSASRSNTQSTVGSARRYNGQRSVRSNTSSDALPPFPGGNRRWVIE